VFEVNKSHVLCGQTEKFGISSKLEEIMCLLAQECVFDGGENMLAELLGISVSAKQIQRVSEYYGEKLEEMEEEYQEETQSVPVVSDSSEEPVYITVDVSMVYTREESWKEMKVGRIYSEHSRVAVQETRTEVTNSLYVCALGTHKDFFKKFDPYVAPYPHKVFIADDAKWIWNWVEDFYAGSVQILDFYHAVEKLCAYATLAFKDKEEPRQWLDLQKQRLKTDAVEKLLEELKEIDEKTSDTSEIGKVLKDVVRYYENNSERMKYGSFMKKGYIIGSGAIESAHRNVIQQRLKLSGQRWSVPGAQRIANLRAYRKSKRWENLIQQIKSAA
jgi:hypothetical protein